MPLAGRFTQCAIRLRVHISAYPDKRRYKRSYAMPCTLYEYLVGILVNGNTRRDSGCDSHSSEDGCQLPVSLIVLRFYFHVVDHVY